MALCFRRLIPIGWEWLRAELARQPLVSGDRALESGAASDLSPEGHYAVAALLLRRILLSAPSDDLSQTLGRAADHLRLAPKSATASRMLGNVTGLAGHLDEAMRNFEQASTMQDALRWPIQLDSVRLLADAGRIDEARTRLDAMPVPLRRNHWFRLSQAYWHHAAGDTHEALDDLSSLLSRWPDAPDLLCEEALMLWAVDRHEEAVRRFARIVVVKPQSATAAWNYAAALILTGQESEARDYIDGTAPNVVALDARLQNALKRQDRPRAGGPARLLAGDISAFSLPDVLNLLWQRRSSGTLVLQSNDGGQGELHMWSGALIGAKAPTTMSLSSMVSTPSPIDITPFECGRLISAGVSQPELRTAIRGQVQKGLLEMLGWQEGRFHFEPLGSLAVTAEISDELTISTPAVLLEACTQLDEMKPRTA